MLLNRSIILLILTVLLFSTVAFGSFEAKGHGCNFIGTGSSGLASPEHSFAIFLNPAKIFYTRQARIELFYRNFYSIKSLSQISLNSAFRLYKIPFGVGISRYGNKLYSETELRFGSAYQFFSSLTFGISLNWYILEINRYGNAHTFGLDFAGMYKINSYLATAFVISNLNEPVIGTAKEKIPLNFTLAFSFKPIPEFEIDLDIVKDNEFNFDYRFGIRYNMYQWFTIMAGFKELVGTFTAGFNLSKSRFKLAYSLEYHPVLGISNSFGVGYEL